MRNCSAGGFERDNELDGKYVAVVNLPKCVMDF